MEITLRPARHDSADAELYARYLDQAAGGMFAAMFGARMVPVVARVSLSGQTEMSLAHVTVAEREGRAVGMCSGCQGPQPDLTWPIVRAAGLHSLRAAAVTLAGLPVITALERRRSGEWYLQSIAVDPDVRGTGVGSLLLADALDRARSAGASRMVLDVDARNTRARALYERWGMRVESTSGTAWLMGGVRVHRMGMDVDAAQPCG